MNVNVKSHKTNRALGRTQITVGIAPEVLEVIDLEADRIKESRAIVIRAALSKAFISSAK